MILYELMSDYRGCPAKTGKLQLCICTFRYPTREISINLASKMNILKYTTLLPKYKLTASRNTLINLAILLMSYIYITRQLNYRYLTVHTSRQLTHN